MSSSHIEILRLNHEISEKYELAIGDELDKKPNGVCKLYYHVLFNFNFKSFLYK